MKQLLLVEDEAAVAHSLTMALEFDFEVHTATNGRAALDRLTAKTFDVVILDLMMPVLSGEELLRELEGKRHRRSWSRPRPTSSPRSASASA